MENVNVNAIDQKEFDADKEYETTIKKKRSGGVKTRNGFPRGCGVYKITTLHDNSFYIGSSNNVNRRCITHFTKLRCKKHDNVYLQNIFNKYGESDLKFEVIELCEVAIQFDREQYYINELLPTINIRKDVLTNFGMKHTEETKLKISKANTGRKISEETRELFREVNTGRPCSEETKLKMSKSHKGHICKEESKLKSRITQGTRVVQLDMNFNVIKVWNSMGECESMGFQHSAISLVCSGKRNSHKGYIWRKESEWNLNN